MKAIHIDGPPKAFFEYKDGEEMKVCKYRVFGGYGDNPVPVIRAAMDKVNEIERYSSLNALNDEVPIIFWRRRLECVFEDALLTDEINLPARSARWKVSFRLGCIPDLTDEQWAIVAPIPEGYAFKTLNQKEHSHDC